MKKSIKTWSLRLFSIGFISLVTIIMSVLNPSFLYANKTEIGNYTIHHDAPLAPEFEQRLANVHSMIQQSELFEETLKLNICLNDGSFYPTILEKLRGPAFGWGFHNISTYKGDFDFKANTVELNGYKWNLEQLVAHELAHCLQYTKFGFFKSNPVGSYPEWKWEGYAEYVARKNEGQLSLAKNIQRIELARQENPDDWGVFFEDGTVAPRMYYDYWLLVQYCLDIKKMTYLELLDSEVPRATLEKEMSDWYLASSASADNPM